ncbi:MAG: hypothetical protein IKM39_04360 [Clostridia bacterium]|nr:hypothetical protein [Clostridia bacterium]
MKRFILTLCLILTVSLLTGCGGNSYSQESTSKKFELSNVSLITLSGPNHQASEGTTVDLQPGQGDYTKLVQLVTGEKLSECPTNNFGLCWITYTINTGETVKVYPANDGSNYVCLYSLNPAVGKYMQLPEETMAEIQKIFEINNIQVIY